jgi:DNA-directed RNA polymerase specialized sigma24 family protein
MTEMDSTYWRMRVFEQWDLINRLAGRRFPDAATAEEASLFVLDALKTDEWRRVRSYQGRSRFTTFLTVTVNRLLEDFSRSKFGRFRVPKWVSRQGPIWEQVFRLLCGERLSVDEVVEAACAAEPEGRSRETVVQCAQIILAEVPDCGSRKAEAVAVDPATLDAQIGRPESLPQLSPEDLVAAVERTRLISGLGAVLIPDEAPGDDARPVDETAVLLFNSLKNKIKLDVEEKLMLKAVYQDGLSVVAAGRLLGWSTDESHRRLRRTLRRIRQAFEEAGLSEEIRLLLEAPGDI